MSDLRQGCVLFDLDGTLVDTARDLIAPANLLRVRHGLSELPFESLRNWVSHGAARVLRQSFPEWSDEALETALAEFLDLYRENVCVHSALFPGMQEVLDLLSAAEISWGIVTNKPGFLTEPLIEALEIHPAPGCLVCGDTLAVKKPDPAPIEHACAQLRVAACNSIYVGDAARDVEAGRRAGCHSVGVTWGYILPEDAPEQWGADLIVHQPEELIEALRRRLA